MFEIVYNNGDYFSLVKHVKIDGTRGSPRAFVREAREA